MNKNTALKTAGVVFSLIALAQASRLLLRFDAYIGSAYVPVWINAIACVVMAALAVWMFRASR